MTTNHTWEEQTRRELAQVQSELKEAMKQYEEIKHRVENLTVEARAFELALESHLRRTGRQDSLKSDMREILTNQKNHKERIKRIAEQNNGVLKVSSAADILYNYQILKSKTRLQAYRIVYGLIIGMIQDGIFQKSAPGEFRLIETKPKLPVS